MNVVNPFPFLPDVVPLVLSSLPDHIMQLVCAYIIDLPLIFKKSCIVEDGFFEMQDQVLRLRCQSNIVDRSVFCTDLTYVQRCNRWHLCEMKLNCQDFWPLETTFWNLKVINSMYDIMFLPYEDNVYSITCLTELRLSLLNSISDIPGRDKMIAHLENALVFTTNRHLRVLLDFKNKFEWGFFGTSSAVAILEYLDVYNVHSHCQNLCTKYILDDIENMSLWERRINDRDSKKLYMNGKYVTNCLDNMAYEELTEIAFVYKPVLRL